VFNVDQFDGLDLLHQALPLLLAANHLLTMVFAVVLPQHAHIGHLLHVLLHEELVAGKRDPLALLLEVALRGSV